MLAFELQLRKKNTYDVLRSMRKKNNQRRARNVRGGGVGGGRGGVGGVGFDSRINHNLKIELHILVHKIKPGGFSLSFRKIKIL